MKRIVYTLIVFAIITLTGCPGVGPGGRTNTQTEHAWMSSLDDAMSQAAADGRLVLMLAGRDTCGNCNYMKDTICEASNVRAVLLENYVTAYIDVDNSTSWYPYAPGGGFILPLIASIDPNSPGTAIHSTTSIRNEQEFLSDIQGALE